MAFNTFNQIRKNERQALRQRKQSIESIKQYVTKKVKQMKKNVEINSSGALALITNKSGLTLSHKNLAVDEGTANIYTKGLLVGNLVDSDVLHIKETIGSLKIANDYDTTTQRFDEVIVKEGFYIVFEAAGKVLDVTYDDAYKPNFKPINYEGTYYYNLHTSKTKLYTSMPRGYQVDSDRTKDGVKAIYDPTVRFDCSVCGRVTVSEDTCPHHDEAKALWNQEDRGLRSYSYTPNFQFRTVSAEDKRDNGTFGIELEMVAPSNQVHPRMSPAYEDDEFLYLMSDGSLPKYGCEMACHPFSFKWYKGQDDPFRLKYLKHIGMLSKSESACGLHIHISKTTFKSDNHFDAWYRLMTCNIKYLETIAGRSMGGYNQACHYPNSTKKKVDDDTNRTDAIANRGQTIEFRMMKGDIDKVEFGVEMLQATIEYSKTVKTTVGWTKFKKWLSTRQETYPNITSIFIDKKVPLGIFSIPVTDQDWLSDFNE